MEKIRNLTIIGMGVVGSAVYANCNLDTIHCYDKHTHLGLFTDQNIWTDAVFVCVDTPMQELGKQDASKLFDILLKLEQQEYKGIIIVKSTVLEETLKDFGLNIVYNPEFLTARNAVDDMKSESYIILGGDIIHTKRVAALYKNCFDFSYAEKVVEFEFCSIKEAIDFKYMRNIHQAWNVSFWEMMNDLDMNAGKMSMMLSQMPVEENSNISQDGYRGYGQSFNNDRKDFSACLDKDVGAMLFKHKHKLLNALNDYNQSLLVYGC